MIRVSVVWKVMTMVTVMVMAMGVLVPAESGVVTALHARAPGQVVDNALMRSMMDMLVSMPEVTPPTLEARQHTHTHTCIHTRVHARTYNTNTRAQVMCIKAFICVNIHSCMRAYVCMCKYMCKYVCMCKYMCKYVCMSC